MAGGLGARGGGRAAAAGGGERGGKVDEVAELLADRYLGDDGKPLAATAKPWGELFKRLPVRLALQMDQRWIPQLIVECANATLPIEVQQVRINPAVGDGGGGVLGRGGRGGRARLDMGDVMGRPGRGGQLMRGRAGPLGDAAPARNAGQVMAFDREPEYVRVIIQGTVYIYQPPSAEVLGEGQDGANQVAGGP